MIDLHTHSTASDGTLSPTSLVEAAEQAGLAGLALTDHDTVAGLAEAKQAAEDARLDFIPGVEISAQIDRGCLHIVGLYVDSNHKGLLKTLEDLVNLRNERNIQIVKKLCELKLPVEIDEVAGIAGGSVVGRPHFAELMRRKGYIKKADDAFKRYLARGMPAYVPKHRLDPRAAMELIRAAGGVPILAHPDQTKREGAALETLIAELTDIGLEGIEVYCSGYVPGLYRQYKKLADKYGLVQSGGSDFHGAIKPDIRLGRGPGRLYVPDDLLAPIADRAAQIQRARR